MFAPLILALSLTATPVVPSVNPLTEAWIQKILEEPLSLEPLPAPAEQHGFHAAKGLGIGALVGAGFGGVVGLGYGWTGAGIGSLGGAVLGSLVGLGIAYANSQPSAPNQPPVAVKQSLEGVETLFDIIGIVAGISIVAGLVYAAIILNSGTDGRYDLRVPASPAVPVFAAAIHF